MWDLRLPHHRYFTHRGLDPELVPGTAPGWVQNSPATAAWLCSLQLDTVWQWKCNIPNLEEIVHLLSRVRGKHFIFLFLLTAAFTTVINF